MAATRDRIHLFNSSAPQTVDFTPHRPKMLFPPLPSPEDRAVHATGLRSALEAAVIEAAASRQNVGIQIQNVSPGIYVEFSGAQGIPLDVSGISSVREGIELVALRRDEIDLPNGKSFVEKATVIVPDDKIGFFLARFEAYSRTSEREPRERRYENTIDRIANLRLATLRALWTDDQILFPTDANQSIWWEVWLRRKDGRELERLSEFSELSEITVSERRLEFPDRTVTLVRATTTQLSSSILVLNDIAEVRKVAELSGFFDGLQAVDQADWVNEFLLRSTIAVDDAPAVCVLDTGVNRGHPLLASSLATLDLHACDSAWLTTDHEGHGTEMAGLALYGNLAPLLASSEPIVLTHKLESVKLLPPPTASATIPELYGAVTAIATSLPEITAPNRQRCFSMSIGADGSKGRGKPTSWSTAVDALAAGRSFDATGKGLVYLDNGQTAVQRLFIVSAGNTAIDGGATHYFDVCDTTVVDDPGQSWNALTVGACTDFDQLDPITHAGWQALAKRGDLSPWSATSVIFESGWPNKPDVVAEGGNVAFQPPDQIDDAIGDLKVLTTHHKPSEKLLALSWATSAACAQVAQIAAKIMASYPNYWPETVRGLVVHSANWTTAMKAHLADGTPGGRSTLVRRYGFGVPSLARALRSAKDSLTLVMQNNIRPYVNGKMKDIQFYELPWPKDQLAQLAEAGVTLKVTLSYFVEPNPSRRGWRKKHRYQSHGLRFRVIGPTESVDDFRKRLNKEELADGEERPDGPDDNQWFLGPKIRERGSIHSDIWTGSALDLSERSIIAVYPVGGWWKEQPKRDRSEYGARYSLIVSIETTEENVDVWTPVALQLGVEIDASPIEIQIQNL